ncbi:MAG: ABC transporter permease [Acidobacteriota bacterium]
MHFAQDLKIALRSLAKNPVVSIAVVLALALGIGANTVAFSLIDTLLLRPLPGLAEPKSLVAIYTTQGEDSAPGRTAYADYRDLAAAENAVSGLVATAALELSLTREGPSDSVSGLAVSHGYFQLLGIAPTVGRLLGPDDTNQPVAVIHHDLWHHHFGADRNVIGRTVRLNGQPMTVIGVTPPGFRGTAWHDPADIWIPLEQFNQVATGISAHFSGDEDRKRRWLHLVGRLAHGVSTDEAQTALGLMADRLAEAHPETNTGRGVQVYPLAQVAFGVGNRQKLTRYSGLLMAVTAIVLLVACLDIASLMVARGLARRREIAVRLSLGASTGRLVRSLLTESLTLALAGGVLGLALARAAMPIIERSKLPVAADFELHLDARVLAFGLAASVLCGLLFGLLPAWRSVRAGIVAALRGEVPIGRRWRLGSNDLLVFAQVVLALLVLVGSGLMLRTLANLRAIDPGYDPRQTLVTSLDLSRGGYSGPRVTTFYQELVDRLRRLPGIQAASMASALPMVGADLSVHLTVGIEGAPARAEGEKAPAVHHTLVGSRYFATAGMELLQGRDFNRRDTNASAGVAIVNQTMARQFWPDRGPLGRRLTLVQTEEPFEVVGVVSDAKYADLKEETGPVLYLYQGQQEKSFLGALLAPAMTVLVRTLDEPRGMLSAVRSTVSAMDPHLPVYNVRTLDEILSSEVAIERQAALLFSGFALLAIVLVMVGLYGIVSQAVDRRRHEVGVRMTCGAQPGAVLRLMLRRSAISSLAGIAVGLGAAVLASRALASYLYGVTRTDPATLTIAALGLLTITLAAAALPARRAARIDPVTVLRED